jgi:hypothetical protein
MVRIIDPTEGQLRWQIYTSLAYGARGFFISAITRPPAASFPKGAHYHPDDRKTRIIMKPSA